MLYILIGKSASGKDTILNGLVKNGFTPLISHTTRQAREGETEGKEYYFVSDGDFEKLLKQDRFVETREYHTLLHNVPQTWHYGLSKQELEPNKNYTVIVDVMGAKQLLAYYGEENCKVCYIYLDDKTRTERAKARGSFCDHEWSRRMVADNKDFCELNLSALPHKLYYNKYEVDYIIDLIKNQK